jgi:hypothetical protein
MAGGGKRVTDSSCLFGVFKLYLNRKEKKERKIRKKVYFIPRDFRSIKDPPCDQHTHELFRHHHVPTLPTLLSPFLILNSPQFHTSPTLFKSPTGDSSGSPRCSSVDKSRARDRHRNLLGPFQNMFLSTEMPPVLIHKRKTERMCHKNRYLISKHKFHFFLKESKCAAHADTRAHHPRPRFHSKSVTSAHSAMPRWAEMPRSPPTPPSTPLISHLLRHQHHRRGHPSPLPG